MYKKYNQILTCNVCDYTTSSVQDYSKHITTRNHEILTNTSKMSPNFITTPRQLFVCKSCDYTTSRRVDYMKHINTRKHIKKSPKSHQKVT